MIMDKHKLALLFPLSCLLGCTPSSTLVDAPKIHIDDFASSTFAPMQQLQSVDSLRLYMRDSLYLGNVIDMCQTDTCIYLLDDAKAISMFDRHTGRLIRQVRNIGRGKGEYIDPRSIDVANAELFVLDLQGMSLIAYNAETLDFVSKKRIAVPAIDFTPVEGGFLFYNPMPTERAGRLVFTDKDCKVIDSFQLSDGRIESLATTCFFNTDSKGRVFISDPSSGTLYEWNGKEPVCLYKVVYDGKEQGAQANGSDVQNAENFVLPDKVLTSFLHSGKRFYNLYDRKAETSQNGMNQQSALPFFPRWQCGCKLIGIRPTGRQQGAIGRDSSECVVYSFSLK